MHALWYSSICAVLCTPIQYAILYIMHTQLFPYFGHSYGKERLWESSNMVRFIAEVLKLITFTQEMIESYCTIYSFLFLESRSNHYIHILYCLLKTRSKNRHCIILKCGIFKIIKKFYITMYFYYLNIRNTLVVPCFP